MAAEWIQAEENFAFVRRLTQFLVCVSISFNCLTAYFILFYSPKHLAGYKYVLLNICAWSISVDLHVAFLFLPMPHLEIVGGYATGILDFLDARGGFFMLLALIFLLQGYIFSLGYAFIYRLMSIKYPGIHILLNSKIGAVILGLLHIITGVGLCANTDTVYISTKEYKEIVRERYPAYLTMFDYRPLFGSAFDKRPIIEVVGVITLFIIIWVVVMIYCLIAIIVEMRKSKYCMSARAYRTQVQLLRALTVQTFIPLVLLFAPIGGILAGFLLHLSFHNTLIEVAEVFFAIHSSINCIALILLITPYRNAGFMLLDKLADKIDKKTSKGRRNTVVDTTVSNIYFVASQHNIDGGMGFT